MVSRLFAFLVEFFDGSFRFIFASIERFFRALKRVERLSDDLFDSFSSLGDGVRLRVAAEKG